MAERNDSINSIPGMGFPPGTFLLSDKYHSSDHSTEVIIHPTPTSDPNDPLNWSKWRKGVNFGIACFYVLITFVFLDIGAVAFGPVIAEFGWSLDIFTYGTAAAYAGLAFGCVVFIPFIHRYGRRPIYLLSLIIQLAASIWSAKVQTAGDMIGANIVAGIGGAISETIVQVTIGDLFFVHQRATMNGIFLLMQSSGAFLGPVAAGYVAAGLGWRWMWWLTAIFSAINLIATAFLFEETMFVPSIVGERRPVEVENQAPEVPANKDKAINTDRLERGDSNKVSAGSVSQKPYTQRMALFTKTDTPIAHRFYDPFIAFFTIPAVAYVSMVYGLLLSFFAVMGTIMSYFMIAPPYNFGSASIGLLSIAPFIGSGLGAFIGGPTNDRVSIWLASRNGGIFEPEMRLWLVFPGVVLCIVGICMNGLGLADQRPWPVIACGFGFFGAGFSIVGSSALTYLTDAYLDIVSDAFVSVTFWRNGFSIAVLFGLSPWLDKMGLRNVYIIVACFAGLLVFMTIPMIAFGKRFRVMTKDRYRSIAANQPLLRDL
ncbi:major facilitator superfamily transporter [Dactylonectria estremocensis]|uniref:Major facilitator superfamily transporter n=1 Tax=Dactylonectria estremocensis TaxID=1079267 RepID=A0A9P9DD04_9HYPO|nr:major facilitator superfamily transporter [Dactylonectria estremocensis]